MVSTASEGASVGDGTWGSGLASQAVITRTVALRVSELVGGRLLDLGRCLARLARGDKGPPVLAHSRFGPGGLALVLINLLSQGVEELHADEAGARGIPYQLLGRFDYPDTSIARHGASPFVFCYFFDLYLEHLGSLWRANTLNTYDRIDWIINLACQMRHYSQSHPL